MAVTACFVRSHHKGLANLHVKEFAVYWTRLTLANILQQCRHSNGYVDGLVRPKREIEIEIVERERRGEVFFRTYIRMRE